MADASTEQLVERAVQLHRSGRLAQAATLYQEALARDPLHATALHMLGVIAGQAGQWETAVELIGRSLEVMPGDALAHSNLGKLFFDRAMFAESAEACRAAVRLDSTLAEGQFNLGNALYSLQEIDAAIACFRHAVRLRPDYAKAHHNLVNAYKDRGEMAAAVAASRRVIELRPDLPASHSNLIFTMLFDPASDPAAVRNECEVFDRRHAAPLTTLPAVTDPALRRRLRVGYVSPNFREHCQALFTVPLFSAHDHEAFHITGYSDARRPDAITARLRGCCDQWVETAGMNDEALAARIRADEIDVLVDLTMHMAHNRLLTFARRPAPVQGCWLAYPGTTGLGAMQFRLTDPQLDPAGADAFYTEESVRFGPTFWCYDALTDMPVRPRGAGPITFGGLNNFCKVTPEILGLWREILRQIPEARLLILAPRGIARERIAGERIEFVDFSPRAQYLARYHEIDIALDTFPVNGHTTSLDALYMGVPVVTRVHPHNALGRAGLSQLMNLGLPALVAHTAEEYVRIAVELAGDRARLARLRGTLRERMQRSPLMNATQFARGVEAAYRTAWISYLEKNFPAHILRR